jgi:hypothetical protein
VTAPLPGLLLPNTAFKTVMPYTIAETCDKLEGSPQTKWDRVDITTHVDDQQVSIEVKFRGGNEALCFSDQVFDVDA